MVNAKTHATFRRGGALRHVDFLVCGVRPTGPVTPWRWRDGGIWGTVMGNARIPPKMTISKNYLNVKYNWSDPGYYTVCVCI